MPNLVKVKPCADPWHNVIREIHPGLPISKYIETEAPIRVYVREVFESFSDFEFGGEHPRFRIQSRTINKADDVLFAERHGLNNSLPNCFDLPPCSR